MTMYRAHFVKCNTPGCPKLDLMPELPGERPGETFVPNPPGWTVEFPSVLVPGQRPEPSHTCNECNAKKALKPILVTP